MENNLNTTQRVFWQLFSKGPTTMFKLQRPGLGGVRAHARLGELKKMGVVYEWKYYQHDNKTTHTTLYRLKKKPSKKLIKKIMPKGWIIPILFLMSILTTSCEIKERSVINRADQKIMDSINVVVRFAESGESIILEDTMMIYFGTDALGKRIFAPQGYGLLITARIETLTFHEADSLWKMRTWGVSAIDTLEVSEINHFIRNLLLEQMSGVDDD